MDAILGTFYEFHPERVVSRPGQPLATSQVSKSVHGSPGRALCSMPRQAGMFIRSPRRTHIDWLSWSVHASLCQRLLTILHNPPQQGEWMFFFYIGQNVFLFRRVTPLLRQRSTSLFRNRPS
jgi:hypothetical protein